MSDKPVSALGDFNAYFKPLVVTWQKECKPDLHRHKEDYGNLDFDDLFNQVTLGREPKGQVKASHQRRLNNGALKEFQNALSDHKSAIRTSTSFEALHELVHAVADNVRGIGPLMVYDTTLRFGFKSGYFPKEVHLQQGAFDGARLFFERKGDPRRIRRASTLPSEAFAPLDNDLEAYEIENFLCTMKGVLGGVKKSSSCSPDKMRSSVC